MNQKLVIASAESAIRLVDRHLERHPDLVRPGGDIVLPSRQAFVNFVGVVLYLGIEMGLGGEAASEVCWGIWCVQDQAWCPVFQRSIFVGTEIEAHREAARWRSGERAAVAPGAFHYEVRRIPPEALQRYAPETQPQ